MYQQSGTGKQYDVVTLNVLDRDSVEAFCMATIDETMKVVPKDQWPLW